MTQLILHIGGEKTGTTALQNYLFANSTALLDQSGVLYPTAAPLCFNSAHFPVVNTMLAHAPLEFMTRQKVLSPADLREAMAAVLKTSQPRVLLLSAEHFSSRLHRPDVERLAKWCRESGLFQSIRVVFYARPQEALAVSALSTMLRVGWRGWITTMQFTRDNLYFNHFRNAKQWADAFGQDAITVRRYDGGLDIVADFLAVTGIARPRGEASARRLNESMSYQALRLLHLVNQHLAIAADPGIAPAAIARDGELRQRILRLAEKKIAPDKRLGAEVILGPKLRAHIRDVYAEPNRRLKERFGVDLGDAESGPAEAAALPADGEILAQLLVDLARELPRPKK